FHVTGVQTCALPIFAASGMRLDLLETLIRQNPTCEVDGFARTYLAGDTVRANALLARLDTVPRASDLPQTIELAPGDNIRIAPRSEERRVRKSKQQQ